MKGLMFLGNKRKGGFGLKFEEGPSNSSDVALEALDFFYGRFFFAFWDLELTNSSALQCFYCPISLNPFFFFSGLTEIIAQTAQPWQMEKREKEEGERRATSCASPFFSKLVSN